MRIAILGWGSLIWDQRDLPISGDWKQSGPVLPIEFSRISTHGERAGCLTLVIDEQHGVKVTTRFALSPRTNLNEAIADLRTAERITPENQDRIGYVNLLTSTECAYARRHHSDACNTIKAWAKDQQLDAVIWTALISNFAAEKKAQFSVDVAIQHLNSLVEPAKARAFEYLQKAPTEVVTPVRTAAIQAGLIAAGYASKDSGKCEPLRHNPATD